MWVATLLNVVSTFAIAFRPVTSRELVLLPADLGFEVVHRRQVTQHAAFRSQSLICTPVTGCPTAQSIIHHAPCRTLPKSQFRPDLAGGIRRNLKSRSRHNGRARLASTLCSDLCARSLSSRLAFTLLQGGADCFSSRQPFKGQAAAFS